MSQLGRVKNFLQGVDHAGARHLHVQGVEWQVYEGDAGQLDRRERPHLFFECDSAVRRVRDYPLHWRELSDEALWLVASRI